FQVLGHGMAVDGQRIRVQQVFNLLHDGRHAAGVAEVLHEEAAGRHQVDQAGHVVTQFVPVGQVNRHADAVGDGQQVNDGVGGTADGAVDADGVFECFARQNLRQ